MTTTAQTDNSYRVIPGWERRPAEAGYRDAAGVAVDSRMRVHVLTRGPSRVMVYDFDGTFVRTWGEGLFTERTHGLTIGPDDEVYVVDDGDHTVRGFDAEGREFLRLGSSGRPSHTGYDGRDHGSVRSSGEPFNRPTNLAVGPEGLLYVSDGYGNCRVHVFTPEGQLVRSWGEPGSGPGEFRLVHGIDILADGRVLVADRENDRVQVFDTQGGFLTEWSDVQRPTHIAHRNGQVFVSELSWRAGQRSFRLGERGELPSRVSVLDTEGRVVERWVEPDPCAPGGFVAAHSIAVDAAGAVYVAEVTWTIGISQGRAPEGCHTLQKFVSD